MEGRARSTRWELLATGVACVQATEPRRAVVVASPTEESQVTAFLGVSRAELSAPLSLRSTVWAASHSIAREGCEASRSGSLAPASALRPGAAPAAPVLH